jgi:prepilin-type N-terminal cleavage/methylation domain-containing protein
MHRVDPVGGQTGAGAGAAHRGDHMAARRTRRGQDGFTYMEVLVSIVILGVVALGLAQGMLKASGALAASKVNGSASAIASSELDRTKRLPYEDVGTVGGYPAGTVVATRTETRDGIAFTVAVSVDFIDDPTPGQVATGANYKRVRVTVTPPARPGALAATQTTIIAPPTIGAVAERARIIATVVDAITGQPVAGARVRQSGGASPAGSVQTGSDGTASFAALEPSGAGQPYVLSVEEPGYVLVGGTPTSKSLVASETWSPTLSVYKPATIVVRLTNALSGALVTDAAQVTITPPGGSPEAFATSTGTATVDRLAGAPIRGSTTQAFVVQAATGCHQAPDPVNRVLPAGYPGQTTETITISLTPANVGRIDATVVDRITGTALAGATVQLSGGGPALEPQARTTDAAGLARWCAPPSGGSAYDLVAGHADYGPATIKAVVERDATTRPTLALIPKTTSVVRLLAQAGRSVRLERSGHTTRTMTTDAAGRAEFVGVPPGTWTAAVADPTGLVWTPLGGKAVEAVGGELREYTLP